MTSTRWQVTFGDHTLDENDMTVAQAADICRLAAGGWEVLNPMHSPAALAAMVTVLMVEAGTPEVEAVVAVNYMKAADLLACVERV